MLVYREIDIVLNRFFLASMASHFRQVEVPQIQYEDQVVQVPVAKHVHVPMVQTVQKTVEVPQVEFLVLEKRFL